MAFQDNKYETNRLVESVFEECWTEFYGSYLPEFIRASTRELHSGAKRHSFLDEEMDPSVYETPAKNDILNLHPQPTILLSYCDDDELDLTDDLIEPEPQQVELWEEVSAPDPLPGYVAYTPIRTNAYVRGDLWADASGSQIRLASRVLDDNSLLVTNHEELQRDNRMVLNDKLVNIEAKGDVAYNQESMQFVPPEIWRVSQAELTVYTDHHHDIEAWQDSRAHWNNDEDIIEAATVQRLLFMHKTSKESINGTTVLSRTVWDLCKTLRARPHLDLGTIYRSNSRLPLLPIDDILRANAAQTPMDMAIDAARLMCHHVDCFAPMPCRTHYPAYFRAQQENPGKRGRGPLYPKFPKAKLGSRQLFAQAKREKAPVCGNDCFLFLHDTTAPDNSNDDVMIHVDDSEPPENVLAELKLNWMQLPDATPCDIAVIGDNAYTCRQAYVMRCEMFPDSMRPESDEDTDTEEEHGKRSGKKKAVERKNLPAFEECDHIGTCLNNSKCPCFTSGRHCLRDCRCETSCKQRQTGCGCARTSSSNTCQTESCKCFANGRECDPEMCRGCGAKSGRPCNNTQILLHKWKETKVRPSTWGNGLFLVSAQASKGELIAEYTGEIIHDRASEKRLEIYNKTGRNYLFEVTRDGYQFTIDAARAGNETRFINHPDGDTPTNCEAKWMYVAGEPRLGIYASRFIYQNQELFLNYGPNFFVRDQAQPSSESEVEPMIEYAMDETEDDDDYETDGDSQSSVSL